MIFGSSLGEDRTKGIILSMHFGVIMLSSAAYALDSYNYISISLCYIRVPSGAVHASRASSSGEGAGGPRLCSHSLGPQQLVT